MVRVGVYGCSRGCCCCDRCGKVVAGDELDWQGGQCLGSWWAAAANGGGHAQIPVRTEQAEHDDADDQRDR